MKKVIKRTALILTFVMTCCIFYGVSNVSAEENFRDMGTRVISDANKVWTVKFKAPVDVSCLNNNIINIKDLTDGSNLNVTILAGYDENTIKVNPPSEGYKMSHKYKLSIGKDAKSKKGESLPKSIVLNFSMTSKDNNGYTASANVLVSPIFSAFKQITISSTNLPNATKYKIEGNNSLFDIGKTAVSIEPDTIKVSLYDNNGNLLGTSALDASTTKNNISMDITLAN